VDGLELWPPELRSAIARNSAVCACMWR
jgi:hypothetical protein